MASITYSLRLTRERCIEIKVDKMREYVSLENKSKGEIFDAVKWALISKDAFISDEHLTDDLHELIWQHVRDDSRVGQRKAAPPGNHPKGG